MRGQRKWQGAMPAKDVPVCADVRIHLEPEISAMGNAKNLEQHSRLDLQLF